MDKKKEENQGKLLARTDIDRRRMEFERIATKMTAIASSKTDFVRNIKSSLDRLRSVRLGRVRVAVAETEKNNLEFDIAEIARKRAGMAGTANRHKTLVIDELGKIKTKDPKKIPEALNKIDSLSQSLALPEKFAQSFTKARDSYKKIITDFTEVISKTPGAAGKSASKLLGDAEALVNQMDAKIAVLLLAENEIVKDKGAINQLISKCNLLKLRGVQRGFTEEDAEDLNKNIDLFLQPKSQEINAILDKKTGLNALCENIESLLSKAVRTYWVLKK